MMKFTLLFYFISISFAFKSTTRYVLTLKDPKISTLNTVFATREVVPQTIRSSAIQKVSDVTELISKCLLKTSIASVLVVNQVKAVNEDEIGEKAFINALATIIEAKTVILPTNVAVEVQSYDRARTNIQYILKQLYFQKKITILLKNSIDFCDDPEAIDAAIEATSRITNNLTQYDSSMYAKFILVNLSILMLMYGF